jgi:hypothetical protein
MIPDAGASRRCPWADTYLSWRIERLRSDLHIDCACEDPRRTFFGCLQSLLARKGELVSRNCVVNQHGGRLSELQCTAWRACSWICHRKILRVVSAPTLLSFPRIDVPNPTPVWHLAADGICGHPSTPRVCLTDDCPIRRLGERLPALVTLESQKELLIRESGCPEG